MLPIKSTSNPSLGKSTLIYDLSTHASTTPSPSSMYFTPLSPQQTLFSLSSFLYSIPIHQRQSLFTLHCGRINQIAFQSIGGVSFPIHPTTIVSFSFTPITDQTNHTLFFLRSIHQIAMSLCCRSRTSGYLPTINIFRVMD